MNVEIADSREQHLAEIRQLPSYSRLTPTGVDYVEHVLASPPSRVVGANSLMSMSGAVAARFPYMVDYESSSCERPFVLLSVLDEQVVDLLSQPTQLIVVKHDARGEVSLTILTEWSLWAWRTPAACWVIMIDQPGRCRIGPNF